MATGNFLVGINSGVVIYDRKSFTRLATSEDKTRPGRHVYLPVLVFASVVLSSILSSLKFGTLRSVFRVTELLPLRQ